MPPPGRGEASARADSASSQTVTRSSEFEQLDEAGDRSTAELRPHVLAYADTPVVLAIIITTPTSDCPQTLRPPACAGRLDLAN